MPPLCRCGAGIACQQCESCGVHCLLTGLGVTGDHGQECESALREGEGTLAPVEAAVDESTF